MTCDITWSRHTQMVCNKAREILGLLHRRFYNAPAYANCFNFTCLWCILILSILHQCGLAKDKELVEGVQKFVLRVASKNWTMTYHDLLDQFNLPTLEIRRHEAIETSIYVAWYSH